MMYAMFWHVILALTSQAYIYNTESGRELTHITLEVYSNHVLLDLVTYQLGCIYLRTVYTLVMLSHAF